MKIKPIDIVDVKENGIYGRIAFLVDRKEFLNDLVKIRQKIKLIRLIPFNLMYPWYKTKMRQIVNAGYFSGVPVDCLMKLSDSIYSDLIPKYSLSRGFFRVLWHAVLCGKVGVEDLEFAPYKMKVLESGRSKFILGKNEEVIIISPDTTIEEVTKLFQKYKQEIKKIDTVSNIKRDRLWYWKKEGGLSYKQIWEQTPQNERNITYRGVLVAIRRYKKHLEEPL